MKTKTLSQVIYEVEITDGEGYRKGSLGFYTDKEVADFMKSGHEMMKAQGSDEHAWVRQVDLFTGDIDDKLATKGLGPKARKRA